MADRHISTAGSNTSPYDTWAKAATTWASAITGSAAGDRFFVDVASAPGNVSGNGSLPFPGSLTAPNVIYSGVPAATSGLSSLSPGAQYLCDGATLDVTGCVKMNGVLLRTSHATGLITVGNGNLTQRFEDCTFRSVLGVTAGALSTSQFSHIEFDKPKFRFDGVGPRITMQGQVRFQGGSFDSAGSLATATIFFASTRPTIAEIIGFDMSYSSDSADAFRCTMGGNRAVFRDCLMPAGWIGLPCNTTPLGNDVEMWNCTEVNANVFMHLQDGGRRLKHSTTQYRTGGASDGTTPISWEMIGSVYATSPNSARTAPFEALNTAVGSPITVTVEIAHSLGAAVNDDTCWLEVEYLGSSSNVLGSLATSRTSYPTAAAAVTTSSATWSSAPTYKQKLSVTFTPQRPGFLIARVAAIMVSGTSIFVDPVLTIS